MRVYAATFAQLVRDDAKLAIIFAAARPGNLRLRRRVAL